MAEQNFNIKPAGASLRLILVRHGETDANLKRFLQGTRNGMLNATGRLQVDQLGQHLKNIALDHIFTSDLQRAFDTASAIARVHGMQVEPDRRLREWDVGDLEGLPVTVYLQMVADTGQPLSLFQPPGGEMLGQVRQRAEAFIQELVAEHRGESILACSHGDFLRMTLSAMLQIDIEAAMAFHFDNASYSVCELTGSNWRVVTLNRVATGCESE